MYVLMICLLVIVIFLYIEMRYFKLQADYLDELVSKKAAVITQEHRNREFFRCNVIGVLLELDTNENVNRRHENNEVADAYARCREMISIGLKEYIPSGR